MTGENDHKGTCVGGPKDGEPLTAAAERVPILAPGADTEGQLLGFYVHAGDRWTWQLERLPGDDDRLR
jgi:hypothetical protein